ncbi:MAG TPA: Maf family protein [Gammaproteobacteria bacterium]|nr:Maf family protein [Gammaproteobacteria bacterium]
MKTDILYLASQSSARRRLLDYAKINYQVIAHGSDEVLTFTPSTFHEQVLAIAQHKMQTLVLPNAKTLDNEYIYVLTADTLVRNTVAGQIFGKPINRDDAIAMLTSERQAPVEVLTGCCLEKLHRQDHRWVSVDTAHWVTGATIEFHVDPEAVEQYFSIFPWALQCSGAGVVEDHGLSYLKSISGSYTAVLGLPLYELRLALKKMGFRQ